MENMTSALPRVPFTVPVSEMTCEEYLQYQSWRIEIQLLATFWKDWKESTSGGERERHKSKIIEQLVAINCRATRFPAQPLPDDISTTVTQLTDQNLRPRVLSMTVLLQELGAIFA